MTWKTAGQLVRECVARLERKGLGTVADAAPSQVRAGGNGAGKPVDGGSRVIFENGVRDTFTRHGQRATTKTSVIRRGINRPTRYLLVLTKTGNLGRAFLCLIGHDEKRVWHRLDPNWGSTSIFPRDSARVRGGDRQPVVLIVVIHDLGPHLRAAACDLHDGQRSGE